MRRVLAIAGWAWFALAPSARAAGVETTPVLSQTGPGRFEIASVDSVAGRQVRTEAEAAWRWLAAPLGLPAGFPSPIFVRVVPATAWTESAPFRVFAEPGGLVSVRLRWSEATPVLFVRRALVQALLIRLGVADQGISARLTVPLWLEQAAVGWWRVREEPAQMDALKQESEGIAPPRLVDLLDWQRSDVEPRALSVGAVWLLAWLQAETGPAGEWPAMRARMLRGENGSAALAAGFPGRFADAAERELWWQTGWHHARRIANSPQLGSAESRRIVGDLGRFVFGVGGVDAVVPLRFAVRRRKEPAVAERLDRHAADLRRRLPDLHPFYRNAGLALQACLDPSKAPATEIERRVDEFEREWSDAVELETTTRSILDAFSAKQRG